MPGKSQAGTVTLCPYCNSTRRHHWPDGCISYLQAEVAALKAQLAEAYEEPVVRDISPASAGVRYV